MVYIGASLSYTSGRIQILHNISYIQY